jgi:hypothetical protein
MNGKCPQGFVKTANSPASCPYGFEKKHVAGSKCPYGFGKINGCPAGVKRDSGACPVAHKGASGCPLIPKASSGCPYAGGAKGSDHEYPISQKDRDLIKKTWDIAKKNGNIAPKAFIRFFQMKPEKQQLFPAFSNVPLGNLLSNSHFLNQAYTCVSSLNPYIGSLGKSVKDCPYLTGSKLNYLDPQDLKDFGLILFTVMEEELGNNFPAEARKLFRSAFSSCTSAFTFKKSSYRK